MATPWQRMGVSRNAIDRAGEALRRWHVDGLLLGLDEHAAIELLSAFRAQHSVPLTKATLKDADCVLIVTNHSSIDWQAIADHARLVVDSRNALAKLLPIAGKYVQA